MLKLVDVRDVASRVAAHSSLLMKWFRKTMRDESRCKNDMEMSWVTSWVYIQAIFTSILTPIWLNGSAEFRLS